MKAMILHNAGEIFRMEHIKVPVAGRGEVFPKVVSSDVCRVDFQVVDEDRTCPFFSLLSSCQIITNEGSMYPSVKSLSIVSESTRPLAGQWSEIGRS